MSVLKLCLKMVGAAPTDWYETPLRLDGSVWMQGPSKQKSVQAGDGLFMQQLAEMLWKMFNETSKAGNSGFDSILCNSDCTRTEIDATATTDLLCYVCNTPGKSVIQANDKTLFDNT